MGAVVIWDSLIITVNSDTDQFPCVHSPPQGMC